MFMNNLGWEASPNTNEGYFYRCSKQGCGSGWVLHSTHPFTSQGSQKVPGGPKKIYTYIKIISKKLLQVEFVKKYL